MNPDEEKERENVTPCEEKEDMNIIILTDEHLQKIITQAVVDGVALYAQNEDNNRKLRNVWSMLGRG